MGWDWIESFTNLEMNHFFPKLQALGPHRQSTWSPSVKLPTAKGQEELTYASTIIKQGFIWETVWGREQNGKME